MPQIVLDGTGKTKAALVEMAYEHCGLSGAQFERTPEEMVAGLRAMNAVAAELLGEGVDLGYDFPTYGDGLLEEPSGIADADVSALALLTAQRLASGLGVEIAASTQGAMNRSLTSLRSRYATMPTIAPRNSPTGAGWKRRYVNQTSAE